MNDEILEKRMIVSIPFYILGAILFDSENSVSEKELDSFIREFEKEEEFQNACFEFSQKLTNIIQTKIDSSKNENDATMLCIPEIFPTNDDDHSYVENVLSNLFNESDNETVN